MSSLAFRDAVEARDLAALEDALHPDVVFQSPFVFKPYEGRGATMGILRHVIEVLPDVHYVDHLETGDSHALFFKATVGDKEVDGVDHCRVDADGRVTELTVYVRPATGLGALGEAMAARLAS